MQQQQQQQQQKEEVPAQTHHPKGSAEGGSGSPPSTPPSTLELSGAASGGRACAGSQGGELPDTVAAALEAALAADPVAFHVTATGHADTAAAADLGPSAGTQTQGSPVSLEGAATVAVSGRPWACLSEGRRARAPSAGAGVGEDRDGGVPLPELLSSAENLAAFLGEVRAMQTANGRMEAELAACEVTLAHNAEFQRRMARDLLRVTAERDAAVQYIQRYCGAPAAPGAGAGAGAAAGPAAAPAAIAPPGLTFAAAPGFAPPSHAAPMTGMGSIQNLTSALSFASALMASSSGHHFGLPPQGFAAAPGAPPITGFTSVPVMPFGPSATLAPSAAAAQAPSTTLSPSAAPTAPTAGSAPSPSTEPSGTGPA